MVLRRHDLTKTERKLKEHQKTSDTHLRQHDAGIDDLIAERGNGRQSYVRIRVGWGRWGQQHGHRARPVYDDSIDGHAVCGPARLATDYAVATYASFAC